jgi:hypothetical protein
MTVKRTVLTFERNGNQTMLKLDVAPGLIAGLGDNHEIDFSTLGDGTLEQRGEALVKLLRTNQAVSEGLAAALSLPLGSDPSPLYFHVRASSADGVAWEQIFAPPHGFCALDRRWPIGRIANRSEQLAPRTFTAPLRLVAVLSAAGRDAMPQLKVLLEAKASGGIPIALHVISGDSDVLSAATGSGATAEVIGATAPALGRQIAAAKPHMLHVLCHGGGTPAGVRVLAFGNSADFDQIDPGPNDIGSVRMPVNDLVAALLPCNPWLVVLASCESAQAGDVHEGLAAAHEMVSAGIPAVIGMRRLVDLTDTDRFCAALYPEIVDVVAQTVKPPETPGQAAVRDLDWAQALTAPRVAMAGADPLQFDSWTDPVLYAQEDALQVFIAAPQLSSRQFALTRGRLDQFKGALASLDPATANPAMIQELTALIAQLEAELAGAGV